MSTPTQGYYLHALTEAVSAALPQKCRADLESWMENGSLQICPIDMGLGVNVARLQYDALFLIERLPFRVVDPAIILAVVAAWLQDYDTDREMMNLPDPSYAVVQNDDNTADLEISIQFSEPLRLVPDEAGPVPYQGQRYRVASYEIWIAEHGTLAVGNLPPAPLEVE